MCQVRWKRPRPQEGRLLEGNWMYKLPTRSFDLRKILRCLQKEKEILEERHRMSLSFPEAMKIEGNYMGENTYASVARRADTINQENKYRALVKRLIMLEPTDWPKFQERLKKLLSWISLSTNSTTKIKKKSNELVQAKTNIGSTTPTRTTPPKSAKSSLTKHCPVGWGCRIHWLHLCRGIRSPLTSVLDMTLNNLMLRF